ncbi:hypothetical protein [Chryseobacterium sp. WLY505]|uniref:hypothetical protein n=1 Tax=Chryseobacterium sp. WLY505 TaxID=3068892 RepID=UPI0027968006|nr:hypothetical protein [Chryseobacterium sp. WLY505]MDQ1856707.1 hypothetical protein [Chryseobacterium sp. WLY505]
MENILDDINDFDEESKRVLQGSRIIKFAELEKGIYGSGNDPFEGIRTNKTFDEISNELALSTPFGKNSLFYKPTSEDYDALSEDFYTGGINYELLAKDLKEKLDLIKSFLFEPEKYLLEDKTIYTGSSSFGTPVFSSIKNNKPFVYKKNDKEVQSIFDVSKLNTRKNLLSNSYNFGIYFDNYKVTCNLNFIYKDGENKKFSDAQTDATESPYDFKLNDEYIAIKLYTDNAETLIEFLRIIKGNSQAEQMKNDIIKYYKHFFATAKSNPDIIDALYENIPDFVLEALTDEMLWKDFVSLSGKGIDTIGTNENISIINLLKGVKNANWWYNQINKNPEPVRQVFEKFSNKHIEELITIFSRIGLKNWTNKELEQAWKFDIDYEEYKPSNEVNDPFIRYTGFAYYLEKEKKYRVGTALFAHDKDSFPMYYGEKEIGNKIESPFSPMKIVVEEGKELYIPCFVAEYFTNKKIDEEFWIILNNIATGLLPEFGAGIARGVAILSRVLSGRKIKTVEELIEFLGKVDQNVMAEDLEKVGIQALFRGTTRSINGELFAGNSNSIEYGASTSTDPIRAVIFGIESSSKPGTKGVLQIYVPKDLKGLNLQSANYRFEKELEIIINTSPENLSNFATKEIAIEDARKLVEEVYGISLDTKMDIDNARYWLENTRRLTPKEASDFSNKLIKLQPANKVYKFVK